MKSLYFFLVLLTSLEVLSRFSSAAKPKEDDFAEFDDSEFDFGVSDSDEDGE